MPASKTLKGRYELRQVLDQGGMGVVYRAYDTLLKREVAVKTIRDAPEPLALQLFYKECEVLAQMAHPNIVEIFDIGEFTEEGAAKPYFVMPLLPGITLDQLIKASSERLTVQRCVDIICQTCRGLQAAHERGLVHRDLKPSNIFVLEDDSVKIIDFGVAHITGSTASTTQKGTLLYMAPEQLQMQVPTPLSDLFSLGVVAYQAFTRRRPFEGGSEQEVAQAILQHIPAPASDLNPQVNQTVSRVIHKAMAKQPFHRFPSAREFGETLQKAFRNEPIEMFDPARIQPRVQRAARAFEQGDYQFAVEILSELEAEGHLDPAISRLRQQIDQALRRRRIAQLLESARTRLEEEEYPLALQKIHEVLQMEPDNPDALGLKSLIETKRSEKQIDDWLQVARRHLENFDYSHAREAVRKALELRSKEPRALELLAEVQRREQEYARLHKEKEQLYQSAVEHYHRAELSTALGKLQRVLELDRQAPEVNAPDRRVVYESFYNQVRSEHDTMAAGYAEVRRRLEAGDLVAALELCEEYLRKFPGQALFQALKFEIEERQRQQLSAYIADVERRVESEPDLERRVHILKEAAARYPEEPHFQRSLKLVREKRDLVNSIVARARQHEERGQFSEALGQWEILRNIYSQYPGLAFEMDRVTRRRDQQVRAEAKARCVEQIDGQLESAEYQRALSLIGDALREFPGDAELAELGKLARRGLERVGEAQRLFARGQELCAQQQYEEGLETLRRASELDERNPLIRAVLLDAQVERARALLETDWRVAERLVQQALDTDPEHASARSLLSLIRDLRDQESVDQAVAQARQLQSAGDVIGALMVVEKALAEYPSSPRLSQLHATLRKSFVEAQAEESRRGDLEEIQRLVRGAEAASGTEAIGQMLERARSIAGRYPGDRDMAAIAGELDGRLESLRAVAPPPAPPPGAVAAAGAGLPEAVKESRAAPGVAAEAPVEGSFSATQLISVPAARPVAPPAPPQKPGAPAAESVKPERPREPVVPPRAPSGMRKWLLAAGAGVLAAVAIIAVVMTRRGAQPPPPAAAAVAIEVRTTPAGAAIRVNKQMRGAANLRLDLNPGQHEVEAALEGYRTAVSTITVAPGAPASVDLKLDPLPAALRLFSDLEAGKVWLDDEAVGELKEGQLVLDSVAPGPHTLKVADRRMEAVIAFEVKPGTLPAVSSVTGKELVAVVISNLGSRGTVHSTLSGVKLGLDGQPAGELGPAGLEVRDLKPASHELALGEGAEVPRVIFESSPAPALTVALRSDRNVGTLIVFTGEDDVRVFLNGKQQRSRTRRGQLRIPGLPVREYLVQVSKEGFKETAEQRVRIAKGVDSRVEFRLEPAAATAALQIRDGIPGTQVVLDGTAIGTIGPQGGFSAQSISPGDHVIELRHDEYRPRQIPRSFKAGEVVGLGAGDMAMESAVGVLKVNVTPPTASVQIRRAGEAQGQPLSGNTVRLREGSYTVIASAPNLASQTATVRVAAGRTETLELRLAPAKAVTATGTMGMAHWEDPAAWKPQEGWQVRRGGNFVLFSPTQTAGSFLFTAMLRKGDRLRWVAGFTDAKDYALFEMDDKFFYRKLVVNGKTAEAPKKQHALAKRDVLTCTMQVEVAQGRIIHRLYDGTKWVVLDAWSDPNRDFARGRFGFFIPGRDEVGLSNFTFTPGQ